MSEHSDSIAVIGAGSWGTALAILLSRNGQETRLWGNDSQHQREMKMSRSNERYIPGIIFPPSLQVVESIEEALEGIRDILIVVPSHAFSEVLNNLKKHTDNNVRIAWGTKGFDPATGRLLNELVETVFPKAPIAIISGPSFAKEVAQGLPTAVTLTSNNKAFSQSLLKRFDNPSFRIYTHDDFIGVQVCGAVKNGLAVAVGISNGLSLGANARAALITRGLAEMIRLGTAMGGKQDTFIGLAGLGDLVLTCTDDQSRNLRFGKLIGKGLSIDEAQREIGQVVEGRQNAFLVRDHAKRLQVEMPIIEQVCQVLQKEVKPADAVRALLSREKGEEFS